MQNQLNGGDDKIICKIHEHCQNQQTDLENETMCRITPLCFRGQKEVTGLQMMVKVIKTINFDERNVAHSTQHIFAN